MRFSSFNRKPEACAGSLQRSGNAAHASGLRLNDAAELQPSVGHDSIVPRHVRNVPHKMRVVNKASRIYRFGGFASRTTAPWSSLRISSENSSTKSKSFVFSDV